MKREGNFFYNDLKKIYLHFLDTKTTLSFESLREARKELGINLLTYRDNEEREKKIINKIINVKGKRAILSFDREIDRNSDFAPCMENKTNINLALSQKLGYTVDYDISLPEIFSILGEKIPDHRLKEKICQLLEIPYYFERGSVYRERIKILAKSTEEEILVFNSLSSAGKFLQIDSSSIKKVIEKK